MPGRPTVVRVWPWPKVRCAPRSPTEVDTPLLTQVQPDAWGDANAAAKAEGHQPPSVLSPAVR